MKILFGILTLPFIVVQGANQIYNINEIPDCQYKNIYNKFSSVSEIKSQVIPMEYYYANYRHTLLEVISERINDREATFGKLEIVFQKMENFKFREFLLLGLWSNFLSQLIRITAMHLLGDHSSFFKEGVLDGERLNKHLQRIVKYANALPDFERESIVLKDCQSFRLMLASLSDESFFSKIELKEDLPYIKRFNLVMLEAALLELCVIIPYQFLLIKYKVNSKNREGAILELKPIMTVFEAVYLELIAARIELQYQHGTSFILPFHSSLLMQEIDREYAAPICFLKAIRAKKFVDEYTGILRYSKLMEVLRAFDANPINYSFNLAEIASKYDKSYKGRSIDDIQVSIYHIESKIPLLKPDIFDENVQKLLFLEFEYNDSPTDGIIKVFLKQLEHLNVAIEHALLIMNDLIEATISYSELKSNIDLLTEAMNPYLPQLEALVKKLGNYRGKIPAFIRSQLVPTIALIKKAQLQYEDISFIKNDISQKASLIMRNLVFHFESSDEVNSIQQINAALPKIYKRSDKIDYLNSTIMRFAEKFAHDIKGIILFDALLQFANCDFEMSFMTAISFANVFRNYSNLNVKLHQACVEAIEHIRSIDGHGNSFTAYLVSFFMTVSKAKLDRHISLLSKMTEVLSLD